MDFFAYTDKGDPQFSQSGDQYTIGRGSGDRGRWLGVYGAVQPGEEIAIKATVSSTGDLVATFWGERIGGGEYKGSLGLGSGDIDKVITIPADAGILRIELRGWSAVAEQVTDVFSNVIVGNVGRDTPPPAPDVNEIDNPEELGEFTLSWTGSDRASSYDVLHIKPDGSTQMIETTKTTLIFMNITDPGIHTFRVRSANEFGVSDYAAAVSTTVADTTEVELPGMPTAVAVDNPGEDGNFSLSWEAGPRAETHEVEHNYSIEGELIYSDTVDVGSGTQISFLDAGTGVHTFRVRAINVAGVGQWTEPVATTVRPKVHEDQHVYHLRTPDLTKEWVVTVSNNGLTASVFDVPPEDEFFALVEELAATE